MKKKHVMEKVLPALLIVAAVFLIANVVFLQLRSAKMQEAREELQEKLRPAELQVTIVQPQDCAPCASSIDDALAQLKSFNVNITKEELQGSSSQAQELITRFGMTTLPAFIVRGETNKSQSLADYLEKNTRMTDGTFVFTAQKAPYYDIPSQKIVGLVSLRLVHDPECADCIGLSGVQNALETLGVAVQDNETIRYNSAKGMGLIEQYDIKKIPAVLISSDIEAYPQIAQQVREGGAEEQDDGTYLLQAPYPPYKDILSGDIVGLVDLVLLTDESCAECYDVAINKQILQRLGIFIARQDTYDISSPQGAALVGTYGMQKVPAILVSPDASAYEPFVQAWQNVGSVEEDGWFVMRKPELLGTYRDLRTQKIIDPRQDRQEQQ